MQLQSLLVSLRANKGELLWIAMGQAASLFGGIAFVKLLTNLLTVVDYGRLGLALTLTALSQQVWAGPLMQAVTRNVLPARESKTIEVLLKTTANVYLRFAVSQIGIVLFIILALRVSSSLVNGMVPVLLLGLAIATVQPVFEFGQSIRGQLRQRRLVAIYEVCNALMRPIFGAAMALAVANSATSVATGLLVAMTLLVAWQTRYGARSNSSAVSSEILAKELTGFAMPYMAWGLLGWAISVGDRWILKSTSSSNMVGILVVAMQIGTIIPRATAQFVNAFIMPILNNLAGSARDHARLNKALSIHGAFTWGYLIFSFVGTAVVWLESSRITRFLVGPEYFSVAWALPFVFLGSALYETAFFIFAIGPLVFRPASFIRPRVGAYLVTIVLMIAFSLRWGFQGMICAYLSGATLQLMVVAVTARTLKRMSLSQVA